MPWWNGSVRRLLEIAAVCLAAPAAAQTAFVTCQPADALSVIDVASGQEIARWPVEGKPAGVAANGETVYVVAPETKTVRRYSRDGSLQAEQRLEGGPTGVALDAVRNRLYVSDWYNARLWALDARTLEVLEDLPTGQEPAGIALSPDGRFLASADKNAHQVSIFDAESLVPHQRIGVGIRPYGLGFDPQGRLFVGNVGSNDVTVIDPESGKILATIPVGAHPYGVTFTRDRAFVTNQHANSLTVIALDTLTPVQDVVVGEYPEGIDTTADGTRIVFANWFDNSVTVMDATTLDVLHEIDTCDGPRAFGLFLLEGEEQ